MFWQLKNQAKIIALCLNLVLFGCLSCNGQNEISEFHVKSKTFNGYLNKVVFKSHHNYYYFLFYSKNLNTEIKFTFSKKSKEIRFADSTIIIVFYGSIYPIKLDTTFRNIGYNTWIEDLPDFDNGDKFTFNNYTIYTLKERFDAFNYLEYESYEGKNGYWELKGWGIYGPTIYPKMIKSGNPYYIIDKFYK